MKRIGIDSFTVWVNLDIFTYFDRNLTSRVIEVYEATGEIKEEHDRKPIFKTVEGVKYKAGILLPFGKKPILELTINSRMLKKHFYINDEFQTIQADNFRIIFTDICAQIGLECDYYDFIDNSIIYDLDICCDFMANQLDFERICNSVNSSPWGYAFYVSLDGNYLERAKIITGSQLSERRRSSIKRPFVKYYTKYWEFIHKSHEFYIKFCPSFIDENYRRCEGQIKNSRHFQWLEKRGCLPQGFTEGGVSLANVLSLSEKHLEDCLEELILQYTVKLKRDKVHKGINATDFILMKCISYLMDEGWTLEQLIDLLDNYSDNENTVSVSKSRIRKRMKVAFSSYFGLANLIVTDDDLINVAPNSLSV